MQSVKKRKRVQSAFEWMDALVSAVIIVVLLFTFLFRTIGVEGTSMVPTLASWRSADCIASLLPANTR